MKAQWDYRGPHAEERLRREDAKMPVVGRLAAFMVLLLVVSFALFAVYELAFSCPYDRIEGAWGSFLATC